MTRSQCVVLLLALITPFYLSDFFFRSLVINPETRQDVFVWDYIMRGAIVIVFVLHPALRDSIKNVWRIKNGWGETLALSLLGATALSFLFPLIASAGQSWTGGWVYTFFPPPENSWLYVFDLTVGLALVAVSEEWVWRVFFFDVAKRYRVNVILITVLSSALFAGGHWGSGLGTVLAAFLAGAFLMFLYRRTGSIFPGIIVHYMVNLSIFW